MSTAVMPHAAGFDFGDMLKSVPGVEPSPASQQHLAVGAPLSPRKFRYALSRMSSSPATATLTSLLDNLQHRRLERTQSAPAPPSAASAAAAAAAAAAASVNTSRYKTELCRPYEEFGVCKYGDKCQFAHGMAELRSLVRHPKYKTELCRTYHTVGFCPYGPRCHFVHNQEEARQHNRAVAAMLAARQQQLHQQPVLSPALSLDSSSASPASSASPSPTSSLGSFQDLGSPMSPAPASPSPAAAAEPDFRLPVFNRISQPVFSFSEMTR